MMRLGDIAPSQLDETDRTTLLNPSADNIEEYFRHAFVDKKRQNVAIPKGKMVDWPPAFVVSSIEQVVIVDGEVLRAREKVVSGWGKYIFLEVHNQA